MKMKRLTQRESYKRTQDILLSEDADNDDCEAAAWVIEELMNEVDRLERELLCCREAMPLPTLNVDETVLWLDAKDPNGVAKYIRHAVAGLAEDRTRLDWLEAQTGRWYNIDRVAAVVGTGFLVRDKAGPTGPEGTRILPSLREAIDFAREQDK